MIIQTEPCQHCGNQQVEKPWSSARTADAPTPKHSTSCAATCNCCSGSHGMSTSSANPERAANRKEARHPRPSTSTRRTCSTRPRTACRTCGTKPAWKAVRDGRPCSGTLHDALPDLCRASRSGHWLTWLIHTCERIEPLIDRRPRTRRIIGVCPECGREVMAAKGESLLLCKCGNPINVVELREQSRDKAEAIHLTKTPAGMSEWLRENYGYEVSRKVIIMWIRRGKLPSSKPVEDGYYEFSIREIVSMAMAYSSRQ